ncbi:Pyridoxine 5'-phosphate synthase [Candidatus Hartigia pinicola]|nr:Pyridoxine 5'-phosphate synthase [Candidatus Hartigia pinicola]
MTELFLGVNIDHIATIRNARGTQYPNPVQAAFIAEQAGADGITVHLREDRRHITDSDLEVLKCTIQTHMNLEIAATEEMIKIACHLKPALCCLVPENREEVTTEGGLDVKNQYETLTEVVNCLSTEGIQVSLFINADHAQIDAAHATGAHCVEIHTGTYADAKTEQEKKNELYRIRNSVTYAANKGLQVNAGHGLTYHNVKHIALLPEIYELNIGHAIIGRALFSGLSTAVSDMKILLKEARY